MVARTNHTVQQTVTLVYWKEGRKEKMGRERCKGLAYSPMWWESFLICGFLFSIDPTLWQIGKKLAPTKIGYSTWYDCDYYCNSIKIYSKTNKKTMNHWLQISTNFRFHLKYISIFKMCVYMDCQEVMHLYNNKQNRIYCSHYYL